MRRCFPETEERRQAVTFEEALERDGVLVYSNRGTSMRPLIREGRDLMIIHPVQGKLKKYDVPLYRRDSGEYVLHRVVKVCPDGYVMRGDNQQQCETGIQDRQILGVLTAVVRDGREIPVTDWRYRVYAHLWCGLFPGRGILLRVFQALGRRLHCIRYRR